MKPAHFEKYPITLTALSPVHIGSGSVLEPLEYDIVERKSQDGSVWFVEVYDLPALLSGMSDRDRDEYDRTIDRGDLAGVRAWLRARFDRATHSRFGVQVQPEAARTLRDGLDRMQRQGEIELSARHPVTGQPYMPGSSVKGAIRTALLAAWIDQPADRSQMRQPKGAQGFEAALMGNLTRSGGPDLYRDPFRQVAITDCLLPHDAAYIDLMKMISRTDAPRRTGEADPGKILMYRDVTWSALDGETIDARGEMRILAHLADQRRMPRDEVLPREITAKFLIEACNAFYLPKLRQEVEAFADGHVRAALTPLLTAADALRPNECIIRLGRHHHFECGTMPPPWRQEPQRPRKWTNRWRTWVNGELPLGWVRLRIGSAEGARA